MNYLSAKHVISINTKSIITYSKEEQIGIKDASALQMSIEQPKQEVFGEKMYPDIYSKAAILFINLATKHCFFNANKRTAWTAMIVFLRINGKSTNFPDEVAIEFTLDVVNSNSNGEEFDSLKARVIDFLKNSAYIK